MTRTTLLGGPAAASFGGRTFFAQEGILVTPALELAAVDSDAEGMLDESVSSGPVTIRFTPWAPLADLVSLYPWAAAGVGSSLFGAVDAPLVLTAANGVRLTFAAAAIVQMPDLHLSNRGVAAGAVTFIAQGARAVALTDPERVVAIDAAAMAEAASGTPGLSDDFAVTWGGAPWASLRGRDGVRVKFAMTTRPVVSDANGELDLTLERLEVRVSFVPASPGGPGELDLITGLQLQGSLPGRLLSEGAKLLEVAGEALTVVLPEANLAGGSMAFDAVHGRLGEITFRAGRALVSAGEMLVEFS